MQWENNNSKCTKFTIKKWNKTKKKKKIIPSDGSNLRLSFTT